MRNRQKRKRKTWLSGYYSNDYRPMTEDEEQQLRREMSRGQQARELLEHPLFVEAFEKVRSGILQSWEASPIRDEEGQRSLRLMLKVLNDVKKNIEEVAQTGKIASIQREQEQTRLERMKNRFRRFA